MKTFRLIFTIFTILFIPLTSCQNDFKDEKDEAEVVTPIVDFNELEGIGAVVPISITQDESLVIVNFLQFARHFYLDTNLENQDVIIKILSDALQEKIPVRVYTFKETDDIAFVEKASKEEIDLFNASKISLPQTKATSPIIPNETILNNIINEIKKSGINFAYAVDGCYYRAHYMRKIIVQNGYDCNKLFVYGNLAASNGSCCVQWGYHVAPYLRYRNSNNEIVSVVIDPSLYTNYQLVDAKVWMNKCADKSCYSGAQYNNFKITNGDVYVDANGIVLYDNNYVKTNCIHSSYAGLSGCVTRPPSNNCW